MTLLLAASLFTVHPAPLDMPRAEAYLVEEDGARRLEDRYARLELWACEASLGRWCDDDGRYFSLYSLDILPPAVDREAVVTRTEYVGERVHLDRRDEKRRRASIATLSPVSLRERGAPPRQLPRGYRDVDYWQHPTNLNAIVCAFCPERERVWYLAVWELVDGDDIYERMETFERDFLGREWKCGGDWGRLARRAVGERELLREDARHSVTNYSAWHVTDTPGYAILDDLPQAAGFVPALTNMLPTLMRRCAETLPTPLDGSNVLAVARVFADRREYLEALATDEDVTNLAWSAAYWSSARRELVAYLPDEGTAELLKTFRHEAFHQYLSYACSMISASPWLNEGYAQYFEDEEDATWRIAAAEPTPDDIERYAAYLPAVFWMDYASFYDSDDRVRRINYRLAWSIARFLEKGADKVRFRPFRNLKRDYLEKLLETHDMRTATSAAFASPDQLKLFVAEWAKFYSR